MARATRIALDLALVSLRKVGPVVSKVWMSAKGMVKNTKARPLVCNPIVNTAESAIDKLSTFLLRKLSNLRDRQLPNEQKYLERELEKVKDKISKKGDSTSKTLKLALGTAWQYAKTEMAPPNTQIFFHGPRGKKLENFVSKAADGIIGNIQNIIKDIEADAQREIKRKEVLAKAAQEKIKAEAKKKAEEAKKKAAEQLAKAAKEKQKTESAKKAQPEKTQTKTPAATKKSDKTKKA